MNGKKILSRRQAPPLVPLLALILTVAAVLTAPLAMSKYVATGAGAAGARIAKFHNQFAQVAGHFGAAGYAINSGAANVSSGYPTTTVFPKYYYKNNGEVSVKVNLIPYYSATPYIKNSPYTGYNNRSHGYTTGAYHDGTAWARTVVPPAGFAGARGIDNSTTRVQLPYQVWVSPDSSTYRAGGSPPAAVANSVQNITQPTSGDLTANDWHVRPGDSVLLATYFQAYNSMPGKITNQTSPNTGAVSRNMSGYWRTYRINYELRVTQVD